MYLKKTTYVFILLCTTIKLFPMFNWIGSLFVKGHQPNIIQQAQHPVAGNFERQYPLHNACSQGSLVAAATALHEGTPVDLLDQDGWAPLHYACAYAIPRQRDIVNLLLDHRAQIDQVTSEGETPIFLAVSRDRPEAVDALLQRRADINIENRWGLRPISCARSIPVFGLLLDHGANVNEVSGNCHATCLHSACSLPNNDLVGFLIRRGANIHARNIYNATPLHIAAEYGDHGTAECLLNAGSDINAQDSGGHTPLHIAIMGRYARIIQLLLDRGANPELANNDRISATQLMRQYGIILHPAHNQHGVTSTHMLHTSENNIVEEHIPDQKKLTPHEHYQQLAHIVAQEVRSHSTISPLDMKRRNALIHIATSFPNIGINGDIIPSLMQQRPNGDSTALCAYYALYNALCLLDIIPITLRHNRKALVAFLRDAMIRIISVTTKGA